MEENQGNPVVTEQPTGDGEPAKQDPSVNTPTANGEGEKSGIQQQPDRTFTRDEVTQILKRRIDRYQKSVYNKFGVKDSTELDSLFEKAKSLDEVSKERDDLRETVAFLRNNINDDKIDDIRTYFKGKGLQFTEDELKRQLESHPEWVKQAPVQEKPKTTITTVGTPASGPSNRSEQDLAKKIFGADLFE